MYGDPKLSPDSHTKNRPPRFFPPHEPRDAKIVPHLARNLYEKSRQASRRASSAQLHLPRRLQLAFSQLWRLLCLVSCPRVRILGGDRAKFGLKAPVSYQQALFPTQRRTKSTLVGTSAWGSATLFHLGGAGHLRVTATRFWEGTEVLLVSRLAGNNWGLWIAGFAKRFTRSSGMAPSSTRACALTWHGSSPPEGRM